MKNFSVLLLALVGVLGIGCTTAADCESKGLENCRTCSPENNAFGCTSASQYYDPETAYTPADTDEVDELDGRVCNSVALLDAYNVGWVAGGCVATTGSGDDDDSAGD